MSEIINPFAAPEPEPEKVEVKVDEKQELLNKIQSTLKEFDGESNIGRGHIYWDWCNQYRKLNKK